VPGKHASHVLDAEVPLKHRLAKVAQRGGEGGHHAEYEGRAQVAGVLAERCDASDDEHCHSESDGHATDQALHRLVGAHGR